MLVDSDILIWHMRGKASAARFLDSLNDLCISTITYMELVQGMRNKRELVALKTSLNRRKAQVLPITEAISERAVQLVEDYFLIPLP
jgi:predicted nucleic acid-binding protein